MASACLLCTWVQTTHAACAQNATVGVGECIKRVESICKTGAAGSASICGIFLNAQSKTCVLCFPRCATGAGAPEFPDQPSPSWFTTRPQCTDLSDIGNAALSGALLHHAGCSMQNSASTTAARNLFCKSASFVLLSGQSACSSNVWLYECTLCCSSTQRTMPSIGSLSLLTLQPLYYCYLPHLVTCHILQPV